MLLQQKRPRDAIVFILPPLFFFVAIILFVLCLFSCSDKCIIVERSEAFYLHFIIIKIRCKNYFDSGMEPSQLTITLIF